MSDEWKAKRAERKARESAIRQAIEKRTVRTPDGCWTWTGWLDRAHKHPIVKVEGKIYVVKAFLRRDIDGYVKDVHRVYRTSCGTGHRCVAPEHQVLHREIPWHALIDSSRKAHAARRAADK